MIIHQNMLYISNNQSLFSITLSDPYTWSIVQQTTIQPSQQTYLYSTGIALYLFTTYEDYLIDSSNNDITSIQRKHSFNMTSILYNEYTLYAIDDSNTWYPFTLAEYAQDPVTPTTFDDNLCSIAWQPNGVIYTEQPVSNYKQFSGTYNTVEDAKAACGTTCIGYITDSSGNADIVVTTTEQDTDVPETIVFYKKYY